MQLTFIQKAMHDKDYIYLESSLSICSQCLKRVEAKIIERAGKIFIVKNCPEHGVEEGILEEDAGYYKKRKFFDKPGSSCKTQTKTVRGCPFDCGICPDHEQHTCIGLLEITNRCNLRCPTCYANSGEGVFLSLEDIDTMLDLFVQSEYGNAEILQISGGEPTLHPQLFEIIQRAQEKKIKYIMLNTNGLRIATDEDFVKKLGEIGPGFEIYLQFDGFQAKTHKYFRNEDLREVKKRAIANLQKYHIPITLVSTVERGINDDEIGDIVRFGMDTEYVRGINFQPVGYFGRHKKNTEINNRITLTGVLSEIEKQSLVLKKSDFVPLPCNVDRIAVGYFIRKNNVWTSLAREIDLSKHLENINNSFAFKLEELTNVKSGIFSLIGATLSCCGGPSLYQEFSRLVGNDILLGTKEQKIQFINRDFFRISVTSFIDVYNFDIKSVKKDCVHILTKEGKKIPFSTYNMFYRK